MPSTSGTTSGAEEFEAAAPSERAIGGYISVLRMRPCCGWPLAAGRWLLVAGGWSLAAGRTAAGRRAVPPRVPLPSACTAAVGSVGTLNPGASGEVS